MKKKMVGIALVALLALMFVPQAAQADGEKPIQLAIFDPIQLVPADEDIAGLRLNLLYGVNADVTSLDLAIGVNRATGTYKGLQLGLGNWNDGDSSAFQFGLDNHVAGTSGGFQYGMVNVAEGDFTGFQWGDVNWTEGSMHGMQWGLVNVSGGESVGFDLGLVNWNKGSFKGLMLGLVNHTTDLDGLQIGLVNHNGNKDPLEYMVLVNWSF